MPSVVRFNLARWSGVSAKRGLNLRGDRGGTGSSLAMAVTVVAGCRRQGSTGLRGAGRILNQQDNPRFKAFEQ